MKVKFLSLTALALIALMYPRHASAFSTVTSDARDSDGSPAFADPDDKKPAFMLSGSGGNSNSAPASANGFSGVTLPSVGNTTPGAQAFDRAYAHQSGNN